MPFVLLQRLRNLLSTQFGVPGDTMPTDSHEDDIDALACRFNSELHARFLIELPLHSHDLQSAHNARDWQQLADIAHKMLGAVVYCEMPELEAGLREFRLALKGTDANIIDSSHSLVQDKISLTLDANGCKTD